MRLAAISVDLDSPKHYCRIHGLPEDLLSERARELVGEVAVPRLLELFEDAGVPATLFAIGEDLESRPLRQVLSKAVQAGIEVASHSHAHDYALSRQSPEAIREDLAKAHAAITAATGVVPEGFRAPGYTLSPALLQAVAARGYRYDSSAFPAAPYYAAKALVMGALALTGHPSRSVLDSPGVLLAPRAPYHPSLWAPYRRGGEKLWELPMAVAPVTRLPFIGTFVTTMPWPLVKATFQTLDAPLFNLELHAVDVLDASDGLPEELVAHQRDLKVAATEKARRLGEVFRWAKSGYETVTLVEASKRLV